MISPPVRYNDFKALILSLSDKDKINIDFSVTADINYYNGLVFKGFIEGVPNSVLSGGQYDALMRKMNRSDGAVGFAVYTDMLERLFDNGGRPDVDTVLLYGENDSFAAVLNAADKLRRNGDSVLTLRKPPENLRCGRIVSLEEVSRG